MTDPTTREEELQQEIRRLQETLEERNEEIFDLHVSVSSANTELQHGLSKMREESQMTIRRLEEELRRLRHENHRMMQQKQRKVTTEKIITPQHAGKKRSQSSFPLEPSNDTTAESANTTQHHAVATPTATKPSPNIPMIASTHWILMHISPLLRTMNQHITQRLWLARNEIDLIKILIVSKELELTFSALQVSPTSCRYLVGTKPPQTTSSFSIGTTSVTADDAVDLLGRLWTPNTQVPPSKVIDSSDPHLIQTLWETAAQSPERIPVWKILRYLLRHYDLSFSKSHEAPILERLIQVGRQCTLAPRRQGFDTYRDDTTLDSGDKTVSLNPPDWLIAAISCLEAYTCRTGLFQELQESQSWSTWFAVLLDLVEQTEDENLRVSIVRWLRRLAMSHWDALDNYLRVEIVTSATTAELWHRARSAIHVVCGILMNALANEEAAQSTASEYDLFRKEPSELVVESIRFIYAIVVAIQEARRQERSITLWDVAPAETLAADVVRLLARTQDEELKRILSAILDELEEDYNERYAKYKSISS